VDLAELAAKVFAAGVVGAGGAGFPTHKKLTSRVRLLVVNGAECEPLLASDKFAMRCFADEIVAGLGAVRAALGFPRTVIGVKAKRSEEIAALRAALGRAGSGGPGRADSAPRPASEVEICELDNYYPVGDEQVLVHQITGETVPPGGLPLDLGVLVMNVTTLRDVHGAVDGRPVTRRLITVTGEVAQPCVVDAPIGTTAADLIAAAGGPATERWAMIRGGPMMGRHHPAGAAGSLGFGKADSGLVVLSADHPLVQSAATPIEAVLEQASACVQCARCTDFCPRFLTGHRVRPHRVMKAVAAGALAEADGRTGSASGVPAATGAKPAGKVAIRDLADALLCSECGLCELFACPAGLSPRRVNAHVKAVLRAHGDAEPVKTVKSFQVAERPGRLVGQDQIIERLGLAGFEADSERLVRLDPTRVVMPLRHGVGRPAQAVLTVGEPVKVGDVIGRVDMAETGALTHASIDGVATAVETDHVVIEAR
jgi:Na+-translocating ferredoxin:NAD+ oxidoreductase RnfC subunit